MSYFIRFVTIVLFFLIANLQTFSQSGSQPDDCQCAGIFEELTTKIESDYVGYFVEVKGKKEFQYQQHKEKFNKEAQKTSLDKCVFLMQEFIRYFKDGHLFVSQSPKLTDEQANQFKLSAEKITRSESDIRRYLESNAKNLDPIEGIWFANDKNRYAIFRDKKSKKRDFVAILISEGKGVWETGQVKAEFKKFKDGSYDAVYYNEKHFPLHPTVYKRGELGGADIRRGLILGMPPYTWGKEFPQNKEPFNILDANDPRRPIFQIIDAENVLISIPSHSPEYAPILKELVDKNKSQIENAKNLILDLRGNHGGSSGTTNVLAPFILTSSLNPEKFWVGDESFIVASKQNSRYFNMGVTQGWLPKNLMLRIEENTGKLIPLSDTKTETPRPPIKELPKPQNVAILMDKGIYSAGEAAILSAMKSKKVTLFGDNTGGMIDYQSTSVTLFSKCPAQGFYLGYPMFAASNRLPLGGINETGIPPDVRIKGTEKSPIGFIINYYKSQK